jgi:hypothetical protein
MTEEVGFYSWQRHEIILFSTASRSAFGPIPPSNPVGTGGSFARGKATEGVKLTAHVHRVSWLRSGTKPSLPVRLHGVLVN